MLDHFGYPAPLFSVWRQARWYNLHLTEVWLREIRQNIINGREPLPTIRAMLADLPPREENVSGSSPATAPPKAVTSSNPALAAWPTVAQKEPRNRALHEQVVGLTIGIGAGHKPTRLDSPVLLLPFMGNEADPHPGRIRTRSLNDAHHVPRPFPQWILRLSRNMVRACLRKVTLTVIKGVYHKRFAATHCTDFDYSQITAQAFHRKSIGLSSVYKAQPAVCIFCSFPNKTCL